MSEGMVGSDGTERGVKALGIAKVRIIKEPSQMSRKKLTVRDELQPQVFQPETEKSHTINPILVRPKNCQNDH